MRSLVDFRKPVYVLRIGLLSVSAGLAAAASPQGEPLVFGVVYRGDLEADKARFDRLGEHLRHREGVEVVFEFYSEKTDVDRMIEELKNGELDVAGELTPYTFLRNEDDLRPFARALYKGRDFYKSVIIARSDSGLETLADLGGKTIALPNAESTSGFIYPRAMCYALDLDFKLLDFDDHTPSQDTVYYRFYGNQTNVVNALLNSDSDVVAAAISNFRLDALLENIPVEEHPAVLKRSLPIKNGVYVHRRDLPAAMLQPLLDALVELTDNPPADLFDDWHDFSGWVPWNPGDYDGLINAIEAPSQLDRTIRKLFFIIGVILFLASAVVVFRWFRRDAPRDPAHA